LKTRPILRLRRGHRNSSRSVDAIRKRLPDLEGRIIRIRFLASLRAGRRKIYSNGASGQPVYAATFIRKRQIVLDQALQHQSKEFARILTHELFHFVWVRLGNAARRSYEALLGREWKLRARGELGWSAELRKKSLPRRRPHSRHAAWRDYLCESFCDTAAWMYSGFRRHAEFTLAKRHRRRRAEWFRAAFGDRGIPI